MKIAVWHNLNSGGGKRALYNHVKCLLNRGHEIISYCPDTADQGFLPLSDLVEEKIYPLKSKLESKSLFKSHDLIFEKNKALLEHCMECAKDINKGGFDVLFANSSALFYMAHIGRFVNIPKLIYLGEPYRYMYEAMPDFLWRAPFRENLTLAQYFYKRAKHLYRMYWYSYLCREELTSAKTYNIIAVNSIFSRENIKRTYNLESSVCYLGIDTNNFLYDPHQNKQNFVVGLGMINAAKGITKAIESISLIDTNVRPPLIWIGNNKKNTDFINTVKKLAINKGVDLTIRTYINDGDLLSLLAEASVMLYTPNLEPFGLAPLEANACGTAVIAIKEGGVKETVQNGINGYLVNDYSTQKIADLIVKFQDIEYAKKMGKQAFDYVAENWTLESATTNIENLLTSLIHNKG
jgi:glycosyltransferase involved in cell wall biosynthesis